MRSSWGIAARQREPSYRLYHGYAMALVHSPGDEDRCLVSIRLTKQVAWALFFFSIFCCFLMIQGLRAAEEAKSCGQPFLLGYCSLPCRQSYSVLVIIIIIIISSSNNNFLMSTSARKPAKARPQASSRVQISSLGLLVIPYFCEYLDITLDVLRPWTTFFFFL